MNLISIIFDKLEFATSSCKNTMQSWWYATVSFDRIVTNGGFTHMGIAEKIQMLRKQEGLSQEQFAKKHGVSRQAV